MNEFDELMARYFNGEIDEAGAARLRAWLKADQKKLKRFLREAHLHAQLPVAARSDAFSELVLTVPLPKPEKNFVLGRVALLRRIRALADSEAAKWSWWWKPTLAGVVALAVLALCIGLWLPRASQNTAQHATPPPQPDFAAMLASTRTAVASLSADALSPLPAWMSPTASLLDPPYRPSIKIKQL